MKNILIVQEGGGHGEVLGGFFEVFKRLNPESREGFTITVLCGNSYSIFDLYKELDFSFVAYNREDGEHIRKVKSKLSDKRFDLLIFNSAPNWRDTEFDVEYLKSIGIPVFVMHHSNLKIELDHPFVKLGTCSLLKAVTDRVFTPYYSVDQLYSCADALDGGAESIVVALLGTHYPAALVMRDSDRIRGIMNFSEQSDRCEFTWYVAHYSKALRDLFDDKSAFSVGLNHLQIYDDLKNKAPLFGTYYKNKTRYERDGMTGTIPFAVNAGFPVIGSDSFLAIYGFSERYRKVASELDRDPEKLVSLNRDIYTQLVAETLRLRDGQIDRNLNTLRGLLKEYNVTS